MSVISWNTDAEFFMTQAAIPTLRIRSESPIIEDGEPTEADKNGLHTLTLTKAQTDAFLAAGLASDATTVTLPDGGHRGRKSVRGTSLASFLSAVAPVAATPAPKARK